VLYGAPYIGHGDTVTGRATADYTADRRRPSDLPADQSVQFSVKWTTPGDTNDEPTASLLVPPFNLGLQPPTMFSHKTVSPRSKRRQLALCDERRRRVGELASDPDASRLVHAFYK